MPLRLKPLPRLIHFKTATGDFTERLVEVIEEAYTRPFSLQSDYARANSFFVAAAASLGYITTKTSPTGSLYGKRWRPTRAGLNFLEKE